MAAVFPLPSESLFRVAFVCMCTVMSASSSVDYDLSIIHRFILLLSTDLFVDETSGKADGKDHHSRHSAWTIERIQSLSDIMTII